MWSLKSAHSRSKASGAIGLLLSHHTTLSVVASRTVTLSCTERPVCTPVSTVKAPAEENRPSRSATASSISSASQVLWRTLAGKLKANVSIVMSQPLPNVNANHAPPPERAGTGSAIEAASSRKCNVLFSDAACANAPPTLLPSARTELMQTERQSAACQNAAQPGP